MSPRGPGELLELWCGDETPHGTHRYGVGDPGTEVASRPAYLCTGREPAYTLAPELGVPPEEWKRIPTGPDHGVRLDDDVVFVDAWPHVAGYPHEAAHASHVHMRGDGRCVRNRFGPLCDHPTVERGAR